MKVINVSAKSQLQLSYLALGDQLSLFEDSVNPATRKCATEKERMFLNQFCNRPVIRITNTRTKHKRIGTFTDLIESYRHRLNDTDLKSAYKRAGYKFIGQMKQLFGVLKEKSDLKQNNSHHQKQAEPPAKKHNTHKPQGNGQLIKIAMYKKI
jgi:hypothetical protein